VFDAVDIMSACMHKQLAGHKGSLVQGMPDWLTTNWYCHSS